MAVHWKWIAALGGIVLVTTTPWDNWAVHRHIWDFDWQRVTPVDGAAGRGVILAIARSRNTSFFLVETVLVALLTLICVCPRSVAEANTAESISGGR